MKINPRFYPRPMGPVPPGCFGKKLRVLNIADLFCGAGGGTDATSEAVQLAGYQANFTLINHWEVACATAKANFPGARVLCTPVESVIAQHLYLRDRLDVLQGGPECIEFSRAAGKKPKNYQYRPTPWCMVRFAEALRPRIVLIENVAEFEKKWPCFPAWVAAFKALGYEGGWKVFNAADYGDPTTRERLFIMFVRKPLKVVFADPTHSEFGCAETLQWRDAEQHVIDWTNPGKWLDEMPGKKKYGGLPLSPKTFGRIYDGLRLNGVEPLIVPFDNQSTRGGAKSTKKPLTTITSKARHALALPVIIPADGRGGDRPRSIKKPISTVTARGDRHAIAQAFLVKLRGTGKTASIKKPAPTITAGGRHLALARPFIVPGYGRRKGEKVRIHQVTRPLPTVTGNRGQMSLCQPVVIHTAHGGKRRAHSIKKPVPTIAGNRGDLALIAPFLLPKDGRFGKNKAQSLKRPLGTVIGDGRMHLVLSAILPQGGGGVLRSVKKPIPTVACAGAIHQIQAFLVKYYGNAKSASIKKPLPTVTTKDRFALCCPVVVKDGKKIRLRILWRILQPPELAAAQGFRPDYRFFGAVRKKGKIVDIRENANKGDVVKQIGNAWPHRLARALMLGALTQRRDVRPWLRHLGEAV